MVNLIWKYAKLAIYRLSFMFKTINTLDLFFTANGSFYKWSKKFKEFEQGFDFLFRKRCAADVQKIYKCLWVPKKVAI